VSDPKRNLDPVSWLSGELTLLGQWLSWNNTGFQSHVEEAHGLNNGFAELQVTVVFSPAQKSTDHIFVPTQGCNLSHILVTLFQVLVRNNMAKN